MLNVGYEGTLGLGTFPEGPVVNGRLAYGFGIAMPRVICTSGGKDVNGVLYWMPPWRRVAKMGKAVAEKLPSPGWLLGIG